MSNPHSVGGRRFSSFQLVLLVILVGIMLIFAKLRERSASRLHPVRVLAFSPDGRLLACSITKLIPPSLGNRLDSLISGRKVSNQSVHAVRVWDSTTGGFIADIEDYQPQVVSLAFSPDGKTLVTGGFKECKVWDTSTWQCRATITAGLTHSVHVAFSPDGLMLATTSNDTNIRLWDATDYRLQAVIDGTPSIFFCPVSFSPDGKMIAAGSGGEGSVKVWDVETKRPRLRLYRGANGVLATAFAPDGRTLASASTDHRVTFWDVTTGLAKATLPRHDGWVHSLAYSSDGKVLASASEDGMLRLRDGQTRNPLPSAAGEAGSATCLAVTPDGSTLATSGRKGFIDLREMTTGRRRAAILNLLPWSTLSWPLTGWTVAWFVASPRFWRITRRTVTASVERSRPPR